MRLPPIPETLDTLSTLGLVVVPEYLPRGRALALAEEVDRVHADHPDLVYTAPLGADRRLFGADRLSPLFRDVFADPAVRSLLAAYAGAPLDGVAMIARIEALAGNRGSGQGWHRDSAVRKNPKALLYLGDVDDDNGPFEYLTTTHRPENDAIDKAAMRVGPETTRFGSDHVRALLAARPEARRVTVTGPAGTLVLADTRAIHRGAPLRTGVRHACTSYLWTDPAHIPAGLAACFVPRPA